MSLIYWLRSQRVVNLRVKEDVFHMKNLACLTFAIYEQNTLTDSKALFSSKAFQVLKDQLEKSHAELDHCRILLEKLQVVNASIYLLVM